MDKRLADLVSGALQIPLEQISDDTNKLNTPEWNSLAHLMIISDVERSFGLKLSTDQIIAIEGVRDIESLIAPDKKHVTATATASIEDSDKRTLPQTAVVTGASRGIGAAIAKSLAKTGFEVMVNYAHSKVEAEAVVSEIISDGGKAFSWVADVTSPDDWTTLFNEVQGRWGGLGVLVNNAGSELKLADFEKTPWDSFDRAWTMYVKSAYESTQLAVSLMKKQKSGCILNIASEVTLSQRVPKGFSAYATAKHALVGLTRSLATELGPWGIRVNSISPNLVKTQMTKSFYDAAKQQAQVANSLNQMTTPEDIASLVVYLSSDGARNLTGLNIPA